MPKILLDVKVKEQKPLTNPLALRIDPDLDSISLAVFFKTNLNLYHSLATYFIVERLHPLVLFACGILRSKIE